MKVFYNVAHVSKSCKLNICSFFFPFSFFYQNYMHQKVTSISRDAHKYFFIFLIIIRSLFCAKRNFMAPFSWMEFNSLNATELLQRGRLLFTLKSPGVSGVMSSIMEGWKVELTLEPPSGFEQDIPGLESIACLNIEIKTLHLKENKFNRITNYIYKIYKI